MTGEFGLIAEITETAGLAKDVVLGPGDDAAVLRLDGDVVVSTDLLVENVHFKRQWSPAHAVGRKAVAVNVSDVEAMGARPSSIVVGLAVPKDLDRTWISQFASGVKQECVNAQVSLAGGDLSGSAHIVVCVTALGDLQGGLLVTRAGARLGDIVAVCGRLGWSRGGMLVLQRGFASPKELVAEHLTPSVPYGQGRVAAEAGATAMLDISDGLLADLGHIAAASGTAIDVDSSLIEIPDPLARVAAATGRSGLGIMLTGGEDHALVATFPSSTVLPEGWWRIGTVREGTGITVDGAAYDGTPGWDHFA